MTYGRGDSVFGVLKRHTTGAEPTPEHITAARARLNAAIAAEEPSRRHRRGLRLAAAGAAVVLAAAVAVSTLIRPPEVNAALAELATITRQIEPTELTANEYLYTTADTVDLVITAGPDNQALPYLLPRFRQFWRASDGTALVTTTVGQPSFFSTEARGAYFDAGLDRVDRIGETFTDALAGVTDPTAALAWPHDPDQLKTAMLNEIRQGGSDLPEQVQLLQLATQILRDAPTTPQLRAAVIDVLSTLDDIETTDNPDGTLTITTTYLDNQTSVTDTATLNHDGQLVAETRTLNTEQTELGIPAGTIINTARYTPPVIATTPGQTP